VNLVSKIGFVRNYYVWVR